MLGAFLVYWRRGNSPTAQEKVKELPVVIELVYQWSKVQELDGLLYRISHVAGSREEVAPSATSC